MSTVLVTGANGFVGRALIPVLGDAGHRVIAAVRDPRSISEPLGVELRHIHDIGPETDWTDALAGIDAVVHLAARVHILDDKADDPMAEFRRINTQGTQRLAETAAKAGIRRFVFLSTVKVHGETSPGSAFRETFPLAPVDAYGITKLEAERALFKAAGGSALEPVVLRPPLVYGPGVKGNMLRLLEFCRKPPPLPLGLVANRRSMVFVGNLTDAVRTCLDHPDAPGQAFLVRDGEDISTAALIRHLSAALGRPARLIPVPPGWLRLAAALVGKSATAARLLDTLAVDDRQIRQRLDWSPPASLDDGLKSMVSWYTTGGQ